MRSRHKHLPKATAIVLVTIAAGYGRRHFHGAVGIGFALIAAILFGRKLFGGLMGACMRLRMARARGTHGLLFLAEAVPPWVRGIASTEMRIYGQVASGLVRRARPSDAIERNVPSGKRYSLANGPLSSLLMPLALVGLLSDLPLSLTIVTIFKPTHATAIHLVLFATALWGVAWIAGDRSAIKRIHHVIDDQRLHFRVGFRWDVIVPVDAVRGQKRLQGSVREWLSTQSLNRDEVLMVTPIDSPNVLIELDPAQLGDTSIVKFGAAAICRRFVAAYVDDPAGFLNQLAHIREMADVKRLEATSA